MRTTKANERLLLSAARKALGVRFNRNIWLAILPYKEAVTNAFGQGILSPYRDNTWGITLLSKECQDIFIITDASDFSLSIDSFIELRLNNALVAGLKERL